MGTELDTLAELRQQALDAAEAGLVTALGEVDRCRAAEEAARQRHAAAEARLAARTEASPERRGGGFRSGAWVDEQRFRQRLARERDACAAALGQAADAHAAAGRAAEAARQAVVEAKREVEVLARHGARVAERRRRQQQQRLEREVDDLAAARHRRR